MLSKQGHQHGGRGCVAVLYAIYGDHGAASWRRISTIDHTEGISEPASRRRIESLDIYTVEAGYVSPTLVRARRCPAGFFFMPAVSPKGGDSVLTPVDHRESLHAFDETALELL